MRLMPFIWVPFLVHASACSSTPERAPTLGNDMLAPNGDGGPPQPDTLQARGVADAGNADVNETPCELGRSRTCVIDLGYHQGIHDCTDGTQVCDGVEWSPCFPNDDRGTR